MNRSSIKLFSILLMLTLMACQSRAQDNLFLVYLNGNPGRDALDEDAVAALQKGHLENIGRLYEEGKLLLAGPFDGGGGVFILKANNIEQAKGILAGDPAISAGRFLLETLPMRINKGMICDQSEPYEMVSYHFIHFKKSGGQSDEELWHRKEVYEADDDVMLSFLLPASNDFVLILRGSAEAGEYADGHPLVASGQYDYEVRPWWSTNKTFCSDPEKKLNY